MELHYSQTNTRYIECAGLFYYLMELHYSQTGFKYIEQIGSFTTFWNYTILKRP